MTKSRPSAAVRPTARAAALCAALSLALAPTASVAALAPVLPTAPAADGLPLVQVQDFVDQFAESQTIVQPGPIIGYDYEGSIYPESAFPLEFFGGEFVVPLDDPAVTPVQGPPTTITVPTGTYDIPDGIFPAAPLPQFEPEAPAPVAVAPGTPLPAGGTRVAGQRVSRATTRAIVQSVEGAAAFCAGMDTAYRVDCLADQLAILARTMAPAGDYAPARAAIAEAAGKMETLARANASRSIPRRPAQSARSPARKSSRPIVPVEPARQAAVAQEAVAIVEELQTELLRSSENSDRRKLPYQQISAALESNKVLLRSA